MTDGGEQRVRSNKSGGGACQVTFLPVSGETHSGVPVSPGVQTHVSFSVLFIQCVQRSFVKPNIRGSYVHILICQNC